MNERQTRYQIYGALFLGFTFLANMSALLFLAVLLGNVLYQGGSALSLDFLLGSPSRNPALAGVFPAVVGTFMMMLLTAFFAIPMGVGAAIYLEEYARNTRIVQFIKLNIQNLAGVPSIVYGILGYTLFNLHIAETEEFVYGIDRAMLLTGAMTLTLVILPIITISSQEALRSVPDTFRQAGFGIGMTRWQVVRYEVMPLALPGMLTGVILALSRAIGETAPLVALGAATYVSVVPWNPFESYSVLPLQIYDWTKRPQDEFHQIAATAIIILLLILLSMNAVAILTRGYFHGKLKGVNR